MKKSRFVSNHGVKNHDTNQIVSLVYLYSPRVIITGQIRL